jgi:putative restriction endonuclease
LSTGFGGIIVLRRPSGRRRRIHHVALDRGAIGLGEDSTVLVSEDVHGTTWVDELLIAFAGKALRAPASPSQRPRVEFIRWHAREVFRSPARGMR